MRLKGVAQWLSCKTIWHILAFGVQSHALPHSVFPAALWSQGQNETRPGSHFISSLCASGSPAPCSSYPGFWKCHVLKVVILQVTLLRFPPTKLIMMRCSKQVRTSKIGEIVSIYSFVRGPRRFSFMESWKLCCIGWKKNFSWFFHVDEDEMEGKEPINYKPFSVWKQRTFPQLF